MNERTADDREVLWTCEGCSKPICDGDLYHSGSDVELCAECAPDYEDMLTSPTHFLDRNENPLTPASAQAAVDAHLATGGSLSDKLVR